jgi:hypothetical protein
MGLVQVRGRQWNVDVDVEWDSEIDSRVRMPGPQKGRVFGPTPRAKGFGSQDQIPAQSETKQPTVELPMRARRTRRR